MNSTATTYINKINENYPISGKDNNIQGLKDNFKNIKLALSATDNLLSYIKLNAVLLNNPINNFNNNIIKKAVFQESSISVYDDSGRLLTTDLTVDYRNGNFQKFKFQTGNYTINISNWPGNNKSGNLFLALYTDSVNSVTEINFSDSNLYNLSTTEMPFTLENNKPNLFELFSDGTPGNTYVKYYTNKVDASGPLNLAQYTPAELSALPTSDLKNGSLVFLIGEGYNKPAYYYDGDWYLISGTLVS